MGINTFSLHSAAFGAGESIPAIHTADGLNLSPPLAWQGEPSCTVSFVLLMDDPDAPQGTWVHWLLVNIPAKVHNLPTGTPRSPALANGAVHGLCWGVRRWHRLGYQGPQPPSGAAHHYRFLLRALDTRLALPSGCTLDQVHHASEGHVQAEAQLMGVYAREPANMMR